VGQISVGANSPQYEFLRIAFCSYVAEHWSGALARRNKRLRGAVEAALPWVPAPVACRILDISRRRLDQLIAQGRLVADRRVTGKGRSFTVISRSSMTGIEKRVDDGEDLQTVAAHFGLKRARFAEMLSIVCPEARRRTAIGPAWMIPFGWIERWQEFLGKQPALAKFKALVVEPMSSVLRFRNWSSEEIGNFLVDVLAGSPAPLGIYRDTSHDRISALVFERAALDKWREDRPIRRTLPLSIRDCARLMNVKEEVADALARSKLLRSEEVQVRRRRERCTCCAWLEEFNRQYVFGRDLARAIGRSPRHLARALSAMGIDPVAGPGVDACRQIVYERVSAEPAVALARSAQALTLNDTSLEGAW
jgi:hypothetical protein